MKINKNAESLMGIIMGVFILSFVVLGIGRLIGDSRDLIKNYNDKVKLDFLTNNSYNIIDKLDISKISGDKVFYLYKNKSSKSFEIKIGETNSEYKYINQFGEKIDPETYKGDIFLRIFYINRIVVDKKEKIAIKCIIRKAKK